MTEILPLLHASLRAIHISVGFAGLALFWLILAIPKGTRSHVRCGKLFACVTWIVGGSALVTSAWALVHLESFVRIPLDPADARPFRDIYQFIFAILLYLSAATVSGAVFGIQVVRTRDRHDELRRTSLPIWLSITGLCALGLIGFGAWELSTKEVFVGGMPWEAYFIPAVVGVFGVESIRREVKYVYGPSTENRAWLYQHVWHMCGTGVAFHTAFLVFGANRMFGFRLPGAWALLPWIAPPVIGMSLTARYIGRLRNSNFELIRSFPVSGDTGRYPSS